MSSNRLLVNVVAQCVYVVFLGKTFNSRSRTFSPPRCINGNQQIAWGQLDKMLGGNLGWTSIPSRWSRNTPSRFILRKPYISAGPDEWALGSPNFDWGQTLPTNQTLYNIVQFIVFASKTIYFICQGMPYLSQRRLVPLLVSR